MIHHLEGASYVVRETFRRNRNARPTAMYRKLRRMKQTSVFGDYPLLATVFAVLKTLEIPINRGQIWRTMKQSPELASLDGRTRRQLIRALEGIEPWISKDTDSATALSEAEIAEAQAAVTEAAADEVPEDDADDEIGIDDADEGDEEAEAAA